MILDAAERGRSLGIILIGAQQTASEVEERVVSNAALRVIGRLEACESLEPTRYPPSAGNHARFSASGPRAPANSLPFSCLGDSPPRGQAVAQDCPTGLHLSWTCQQEAFSVHLKS